MPFVFQRSTRQLSLGFRQQHLSLRVARYLCGLASAGDGYVTERVLLGLGSNIFTRHDLTSMCITVSLLWCAFNKLQYGGVFLEHLNPATPHAGYRLIVAVELYD